MNTLRFFSWERGEDIAHTIAAWLTVAVPVFVSVQLNIEGSEWDLQALAWAVFTATTVFFIVFLFQLLVVPCTKNAQLEKIQQTTNTAQNGKIQQLELFLNAGMGIKIERLTYQEEFPDWMDRYQAWVDEVYNWIKDEEDELNSKWFLDVPRVESEPWRYALDEEHLAVRGELAEQCDVLETLIDRARRTQEQQHVG